MTPPPDESAARNIPFMLPAASRVLIEGVEPEIDAGRYPVKRVVGDEIVVEADLVSDGHDLLGAVLMYRPAGEETWEETHLEALGNDRWRGRFRVLSLGRWLYTLEAWVDAFATWRRDFQKKYEAEQDVQVDLLIGAQLVEAALQRTHEGKDYDLLWLRHRKLADPEAPLTHRVQAARDPALAEVMRRHPDRTQATRYPLELEVVVDREKARFSTWYEMFPRSCGEGTRHGSFRDCEARLEYVASMGFDVLYLPPIHPIGSTFRKGRNNSLHCEPGDPGSPWAIGNVEGGHKSVHPELGTLEELRWLVRRAADYGLEVALDIAFQASPDHPYVKAHPEWFSKRPDGTIQYAENPPKKYQDIYPFHFDGEDAQGLWEELLSVFLFWIEHGVRIFRVDNPHTKPLPFWEWCIGHIKDAYPDVIFLSEAFTRPKLMYALAKLGFTQSYTYFTWRNTAWELREYMTELTQSRVSEYFRPNFWPNTPDILPEHLQHGGRPMFASRVILAGTLCSNYGIYGPAYELMEHVARPGSEEYIDNEKYEIKDWNLDDPESLRPLIERLNRVRRENPALHGNASLHFHPTDNEMLLCYSKHDASKENVILTVVNLDPDWTQGGFVTLDLEVLGIDPHASYQVHDLLGEERYLWTGAHNFVQLDPQILPAHIFQLRYRSF